MSDFNEGFEAAWDDWQTEKAAPPDDARDWDDSWDPPEVQVDEPEHFHEPEVQVDVEHPYEPDADAWGDEDIAMEDAEAMLEFAYAEWNDLEDSDRLAVMQVQKAVDEAAAEHNQHAEAFKEFAGWAAGFGMDEEDAAELLEHHDGDRDAAVDTLGEHICATLVENGYDMETLHRLAEKYGSLQSALIHLADVGPAEQELGGSIDQYLREQKALK
jgi:hypothetical protein